MERNISLMRFASLATLSLLILLATGCGGAGSHSSGGAGNSTSSGLVVGYVQTSPGGPTSNINMIPAPPEAAPPTNASSETPTVTIYKTTPFSSAAYDFSMPGYWYTPTSQVAYGTVSGVDLSTVQLQVFAETNGFYIQPLTDSYITINPNGTWVCPSHPGTIHVLLIHAGYVVPPFSSLPPVDGVNVLAEI